MFKGILALVFLAIVFVVLQTVSLPHPIGWIIYLLLVVCALYIVAVIFGLAPRPSWWNGPPL